MAFGQLKNSLVTAPVSAYPQFKSSDPFVVETDASIQGLGAVVSTGGQNSTHSLCILNMHKCNYGITELVTLGQCGPLNSFDPTS